MALAWCFEDEADTYADAALAALGEGEAFVPGLWGIEVVNVLAVAERRNRLTPADSARFLALLQELPIRVEELMLPTLEGLLALAREQGLSAYDAAYLGLAMRLGLPLATRDEALRRAAERVGLAWFAPAEEGPA